MNSLDKNKAPRLLDMLNQKTISFRSFAAIPVVVASLLLSLPAFANRPAMDEGAEMDNEAEAAQTPSSVEIMMQQQSRHSGDVLQLPATEIQPGETIRIKLLDYPRRGMSMDKVQQEYGQPIAISDTVGKPPITRWTYADRVVYFEYSTVLHVVAR